MGRAMTNARARAPTPTGLKRLVWARLYRKFFGDNPSGLLMVMSARMAMTQPMMNTPSKVSTAVRWAKTPPNISAVPSTEVKITQ